MQIPTLFEKPLKMKCDVCIDAAIAFFLSDVFFANQRDGGKERNTDLLSASSFPN